VTNIVKYIWRDQSSDVYTYNPAQELEECRKQLIYKAREASDQTDCRNLQRPVPYHLS